MIDMIIKLFFLFFIIMTIKHIYDTLMVGWWGPRKVEPGRLPQWRWSTSFHGARQVAKLFLPYAKTKKKVLQKIVDHYEVE